MKISQTEYANRRQALLDQMPEQSIVVIPSNKEYLRNGMDNFAIFRQRSDFWYLTSLNEANAVIVLVKGRPEGEFVLFCQLKNDAEEIWTGHRVGLEAAKTELGANQSFDIADFDKELPDLLAGCRQVYYPIAREMAFDKKILKAFNGMRSKVRRGVVAPTELVNVETLLHQQRLIKSEAELELLRYANRISCEAHVELIKSCRPGMYEYELEAMFKGYCAKHGLQELAYSPIVGSGENTCILHYISNNCEIKDGAMVLVDAGGENQGYASDITRTYPANGKFSGEQRAIYEVVLHAQQQLIDMIKPGVLWNELQQTVVHLLTQGMADIGLLKGSVSDLVETKAYLPYFMHLFGHWLGLDTHDAGEYRYPDGSWRAFKSGMVTTVEPGIYVRPGSACDERWWNIGVRIEDNILVTETGRENFTDHAPKTIEDLEALMAS